jgi:hypothetical protein
LWQADALRPIHSKAWGLPKLETYECKECGIGNNGSGGAGRATRHQTYMILLGSSDSIALFKKAAMKRCFECNGRFGLIRYRLAQKSFCSKQRRDKFRADTERKVSRIKKWSVFLVEKP